MHRRIARRLAEDPAGVIAKAKENLRRWQCAAGGRLPAASAEWAGLLESLDPARLAALLTATDEESARLRQSSPFAGVLSAREVWEIKRTGRHATR